MMPYYCYGTQEVRLPFPRTSLLSHESNTTYALNQLARIMKDQDSQYVIGYSVMRALGVRESNHALMSLSIAKKLKKTNNNFDYVTGRTLELRLKEMQDGKFVLRGGLIVGINDCVLSK